MIDLRPILVAVLALTVATPAAAGQTTTPNLQPALGADWTQPADTIEASTGPEVWPLSDAVAAGLDDMVHDSRDAAHIGPRNDRIAGSTTAGRALRTLGGGYLVVPVMTIHFGQRR